MNFGSAVNWEFACQCAFWGLQPSGISVLEGVQCVSTFRFSRRSALCDALGFVFKFCIESTRFLAFRGQLSAV
ncbi:hypothetical protein M758_12G097200 [Ceratodon purpureus]|uniref:Uncharacterized protein n=1 Tax=Ceratodon purpureus TaxID=3225 RepID=A0A8T0G6A2_CERPU|nr:hypothetical protein KC19_12G093700 [Ceratodon purpureus]KAG0598740.1 hypothetical protein M758_12G097200 [Ceratodon purpureus]